MENDLAREEIFNYKNSRFNCLMSAIEKSSVSMFPKFDDLKASNVVGIFTLTPKLNINPAFRLISLNSIGNINYVGYQFNSRGTKRKKKGKKKQSECKKCWKNGICMEIDDSSSPKLSEKTLHIVGIKSKERAIEIFNNISLNLKDVEENLIYMNENLELAKKCVDWVKETFKGEEVYIIKDSNILIDPKDIVIYNLEMYLNFSSDIYEKLLKVYDIVPDDATKLWYTYIDSVTNEETHYPLINVVKIRTIKEVGNLDIPIYLSSKIINFFVSKVVDFTSYDDYCLNLDWFLTIKSIFDKGVPEIDSPKGSIIDIPRLTFSNFGYGNINYNYSIGFRVKLSVINKIYNNTGGKFISEYNKDMVKYCQVSYMMNIPAHLANEIRKKKNVCVHSFVIYVTGGVTQSGPHPELNKIAHEAWAHYIMKNYDKIKETK